MLVYLDLLGLKVSQDYKVPQADQDYQDHEVPMVFQDYVDEVGTRDQEVSECSVISTCYLPFLYY